jgi:hypothetical protein
MSRSNKQFLYGLFYIAIFSLIGWWIFGGAPKKHVVEETPAVSPLRITSSPQFLFLGSDQGVVLAKISNPNSGYGAREFSYVFRVYNTGGRLAAEAGGSDFLYASETNKYIFEILKRVNPADIDRADLEISQVKWERAGQFFKPAVGVTNVSTNIAENAIQIEGIVINNSSVLVDEIRISVIVFDHFGYEIAASRTIINKLEPLSRQSFGVFLPAARQLIERIDLQRTRVFVSAR